jgi:hypothetical protein
MTDKITLTDDTMRMDKPIIGTLWCVSCWPKKEYAYYIFDGVSFCEKHFIEAGTRLIEKNL